MEQRAIQLIIENLWWVIPTKLAGVRKPMAEELNELQTAGIGAIVSVINDTSNLALYEQANIPYLWLPIDIGGSPSREQIQELQNFVDQHNRQGLGVAVHCTGGIHRTGTILAAYLICSGSSYNDAMQTIEKANSLVVLEDQQVRFLRSLSDGKSSQND
ncbi:MAG: dual specificity protein phosphatase family protein [Cyanomargarita calcarea GSE-NOS-MK-12-04C]|jgi:protein-tyrosine phosphatase|uniref:Dual specificity protein phosphatase family protein n=1 Tax=Cyanomargarita calcarea GSE-NOS-MK-12-04C TaxID=2839659 RepID=A0A951QMY3_9CYAN|nr:dual specificity protein phosphatase family protein [Cyanomargarita calcarea GSE-NOS-MK-12-04C]